MPNAIRDLPSPNHDERPPGARPDMLVLHYTGMPDRDGALARLTDPASRVSSHYLVDEDGLVWRLVPEDRRAWHAGLSYWRGERGMNGCSIGIELVNPGHEWGYRPFPAAQMEALAELSLDIVGRHGIVPSRVVGHSDIAPSRKEDPGELFDWEGLARRGIGLWPDPEAVPPEACTESDPADLLHRYGYEIDGPGGVPAAVTAFQRHFHPFRLGMPWDAGHTRRILDLIGRSFPAAGGAGTDKGVAHPGRPA